MIGEFDLEVILGESRHDIDRTSWGVEEGIAEEIAEDTRHLVGVDMDALLDRIDVAKLIDRVDLNGLISKVDLNVPGVGALDLESSSIGGAAQVGADVQLAPGFFLNVDAKKVMIGSDVTAGGTKVSAVKVDPWLLSVGIGRRF